MGWVVNVAPRPPYPRQREPVPTVEDDGWALGQDWKGGENYVPTRVRTPDYPARSKSLY